MPSPILQGSSMSETEATSTAPTTEVATKIQLELAGLTGAQLRYALDELRFVGMVAEIDPGWTVEYAPWAKPADGIYPTREAYILGVLSQVQSRQDFLDQELAQRGQEV